MLDEPDDQPGENVVLSTPDEESSSDMQLREIYSRETQVNIEAVLSYVEAERSRKAPHPRRQRRPGPPQTDA